MDGRWNKIAVAHCAKSAPNLIRTTDSLRAGGTFGKG
jgi:hypothetical protein